MFVGTQSSAGTDGRVYGGAAGLVHIPDGRRYQVGVDIADQADYFIRLEAKSVKDPLTHTGFSKESICPGCYMIALFNAAVTMADQNGQSRVELARSMANAFSKLAEDPDAGFTEEIDVLLDPC